MASILNLLNCCLILSAFVRDETTRIAALFLLAGIATLLLSWPFSTLTGRAWAGFVPQALIGIAGLGIAIRGFFLPAPGEDAFGEALIFYVGLAMLCLAILTSAFETVIEQQVYAKGGSPLFLFESKHVDPLLILLLPALLATTFLGWRGRADDIQYAAVIGFAVAFAAVFALVAFLVSALTGGSVRCAATISVLFLITGVIYVHLGAEAVGFQLAFWGTTLLRLAIATLTMKSDLASMARTNDIGGTST